MATKLSFTYTSGELVVTDVSNQSVLRISNLPGAVGNGSNQTVTVEAASSASWADVPSPYSGSMPSGGGNSDPLIILAVKVTTTGNPQTEWRILGYQSTTGSDMQPWSTQSYWVSSRISRYETFFDKDLNGDGEITAYANGQPVNLPPFEKLATDTDSAGTTGVSVAKDKDGTFYIIDGQTPYAVMTSYGDSPMGMLESGHTQSDGSGVRSEVIAATRIAKAGQTEPQYLLAVKETQTYATSLNKLPTESWRVFTLDTKAGLQAKQAASSTSGSATMYPPSGASGSTTTLPDAALFIDSMNPNSQVGSISEFESVFGQDLNLDGRIGVDVGALTPVTINDVQRDTKGARLEKDSQGALYIVEGTGNAKTAKAVGGSLEYDNSWGGGFDRAKAVAVEAVRDSSNVITGYKLAMLRESSYSMMPSMGGTPGTATTYTTWNLLHLDADGRPTYGSHSNGQWVDLNLRDLPSIAPYEALFDDDLDGDGRAGVDVAALVLVASDTSGSRLARSTDKSLYIVEGEGSAARAKAITNANNLEYNHSYDTSTNKREAVAVEAILDGANAVTGYKILLKSTNIWGGTENVTWDINRLDVDGRLVYGQNVNGSWVDYSVYGIRSIAAYEQEFGQDLNGDGRIGVDVSTLVLAPTDTAGVRLARDAQGGLYVVEGSTAKALSNAGYMEYSHEWSGGRDARTAVAIEAQRDVNNAVTGYKLALKQTRVYNSKEETSWEVITLDSTAKVVWGTGAAMAGSSQSKSIAPFESEFGQDLNGDGRIGIDVSTLTPVSSDSAGVRVAKDKDGALYLLEGSSAKAVTNASFLEYDNNWGNGYNKREVVVAEAVRDGAGTITGYKLALKQTNAWNGPSTETVSWDIMHLSADGALTYGYSDTANNNRWVDLTVWGTKSIAQYEPLFGQDLNGDGFIGIDLSSLQAVSTDTTGIRLRRDRDGALYLVDETPGTTSALAIGNSSWLEYSNNWGNGYGSRTAIAVEAQRDGSNNITGYKLALRNVNGWDGREDVNWEVLSLDAQGSINWGTGAAGSSWTKSIRGFERLFSQDLDGDGEIGVPRTSLTVVATDDATDGVTLAKDASGLVYILDGSDTISLRDSFGVTPQLEFSRVWSGGSSVAEVFASAKQTVNSETQYRVAVKITKITGSTPEVTWQIHTVNSEGVLDWSKVASSRSVARFETLFGQDLDGDGLVGQGALSLTSVPTDVGFQNVNPVVLQKDAAGALYIYDSTLTNQNNGITYVVDSRGGSPSFDVSLSNYSSAAFAAHKLSDGTYRIAVKKTSTTTLGSTDQWEVYFVGARNSTTHEAAVNWSRTAFPKDLRSVEALINQDLNSDGTVGFPTTPPVNVSTDEGDVIAALSAEGLLYVKDGSSQVQVTDLFGVGVSLSVNEQWDSGASSFTAEVVAAYGETENSVRSGYKVAVKETKVLQGGAPSIEWKIYSVSTSGVLDGRPVVTKSVALWESSARFSQDLDGVAFSVTTSTNDSELGFSTGGGTYMNLQGNWVPVTDGLLGLTNFNFTEDFADSTLQSEAVAIAQTDDGSTYLAIELTTTNTTTASTSRSWVVHTLEFDNGGTAADPSDDLFSVDWAEATLTTDMSAYVNIFNQQFQLPQ